jgi:hypothetical protein
MNNEELITSNIKYLNLLKHSIYDTDEGEIIVDNEFDYDYIKKQFNSHNVSIKSISILHMNFHLDSIAYFKYILFYRNGNWFKYNSNYGYPIDMTRAELITNELLFKIIKKKLYSYQKMVLINYFLRNDLNLNELNFIKNHLIIFKGLTIDNDVTLQIKALMEYVFELENKYYLN